MDSAELAELIKAGENSQVEFKAAPPRYAELAERICAFANTRTGGIIVIGVEDKSWEVIGVKNLATARDALLQAARLCKPALVFTPPEPASLSLNDKTIVVATIPPNAGKLYQAGGVAWVRRGTYSVPMSIEEIEAFLYGRGAISWETQPVERASMDDLDLEKVREFIATRSSRTAASSRGKQPDKIAEVARFLINMQCAAENAVGKTVPTNAGLLLFGKTPEDFLIQAETDCVLYPDETGLQRYVERRAVRGTLPSQIDQAVSFLRQFVPVAGVVEEFARQNRPAYPLEALREAIVNALVHRDYSLRGEVVRLFYYANRIEVHSPGQLMPAITLEALRVGKVRSQPRNPVIASILRELPGGYMERLGTGIRFMLAQMYSLGLPEPEFTEPGEFVVTFYGKQLSGEVNPPAATLHIPNNTLSTGVEGELLTPRRRKEAALGFIRQYGSITNQEYREITGSSATTALRDLEDMVEAGVLRREGKKRAARYLKT